MATSKEKLQIIVDAQGIAKTKAQLKGMEKATGGATKSFGAMAAGIAGATVALYAMGKATSFAIRVGKEFEQGMANVKAISGATGAEFKALEANARKLGASTKFTATEVAGLQTEFAKLGFTTTEINKVTAGTLALAAATGSDLATAAAVGGATLRGFGLDARETGRVTDVMAKSFSSSALDMQKFQDSMKYVAPVAKMAGFSIEGTTAILGKLANAGIDGSMAGTALRRVFLELSNENSKLAKRLGGSVSSIDELIPALQKLNKEGVSTAEMKDLVGQRAISAFSILLDGADKLDTLTESFRNASGAAQEMADIQLDTLEGKMTIMKSATEGLGIALFDHLSPGLNSAVKGMTDLIGATTDWIKIPIGDKMQKDRGHMLALFTALENGNLPLEQRKRLTSELNTKYDDYLPNLITEKDSIEDIKKAREEANTAFMQGIAIMANEEKISKIIKENEEVMSEYGMAIVATAEAQNKANKGSVVAQSELDKLNKTYGKNFTEMEALNFIREKEAEILKNNINLGAAYGTQADDISPQKQKATATMHLSEVMDSQLLKTKSAIEESARLSSVLNMSQEDEEEYALQMAEITEELDNANLAYQRLAKTFGTDVSPSGGAEGSDPPDPSKALGIPTEEEAVQAMEMLQQYQFATLDIKEQAAIQELESLKATKEQILAVEKFYDQQRWKSALNTTGKLLGAMGQLNSASKGSALVTARLQQGAIIANTASAAMAAITPPTGAPTPLGYANMAAVIMTGIAQGVQIEKGLSQIQGAQTGMDEVVTQPTLIMAGEGGKAEHIGITPLEGPNIDGPQGGGSITVNVSGNVMTEEFTVDQVIPAIREALRRGENLDHKHATTMYGGMSSDPVWE